MSYVSEMTSYWGNALQGIYITWKPEGHSPPSSVIDAANTKMNMSFDIRMYSTGYKGIETDNGNNSNWGVAALSGGTVTFYMLIRNPLDQFTYNNLAAPQTTPHNDLIAFDGLVAVPTVTFSSTVGSQDTNLKLNAPGGGMILDINCAPGVTSGKYDSGNCTVDTVAAPTGKGKTNNYTHLEQDATNGYCAESWKIGGLSQRCVRAKFKTVRNFKTSDNGPGTLTSSNSADIDFEFRKYSISTGWLIPTAATDVPSN